MLIGRIRPFLLLISSISFGLGISLPLMRFEKLWLFEETPSLLTIVSDLWKEGELLLALVVVAFSIIFPLLKLFSAHQAVFTKKVPGGWTAALAKWSMMDVLLVAIVVFAAKTSGLASAISQPGLWFFALSAITVAIASAGIKKR
ncbi:MAG: paraquat-inducible protein A [Pseudomonadota bacterium]